MPVTSGHRGGQPARGTQLQGQAENQDCIETVARSCLETFGQAVDEKTFEPDIHLLHVSFELLEDQSKRQHFQSIPTKLELPRETLDSLIDIAPRLLEQDPEFHTLLKELGARFVD